MANSKISDLTAYTTPLSADVVPIVDTANVVTKKVTIANLFNVLSNLFTIKDNTDTSKKVAFNVSGIDTLTTRTLTVPNASTTIVGTDVAQTLTNKTLATGTKINTTGSDTTGSIYYKDVSGNLTPLPAGSNAQILSMVSGLPAWIASIAGVSFTGIVSPYAGYSAPLGWLMCDGSAVSRTTYAGLFAVIAPSQVFTVTIASPGVFTANTHGLVTGDKVSLTTTGGLPSGLSTNTDFFVSKKDANSFWLFDTQAHAIADAGAGTGTGIIVTTGSQSGVHTIYLTNFGKGDGATTFNLPDMRGNTPYGYKSTDANFSNLNNGGTYIGEKSHQLTTTELASHSHAINAGVSFGSGGSSGAIWHDTGSRSTAIEGSDVAHNNMPPYVVVNYIIKT